MLSHIYTPKKDDTPITPSVLPTLPRAFVPIHPTWRTRFCSQGLGEDLVDKNGTSNFFNRKCGHLSLSLWRAWIQSIFWVTMFIPLTCSKTCLLSKVMDNFWFQFHQNHASRTWDASKRILPSAEGTCSTEPWSNGSKDQSNAAGSTGRFGTLPELHPKIHQMWTLD